MIVQVKRYQNNFSQLHYVLKTKELQKVKKLNPYRYILVVSVSLLPNQVDEIHKLFSPYIHTKYDIIGREDINQLLGLPEYHEVEKRHYKLWFTSSNVLRNLLHEEFHRGSINDTKDELERIQSNLPLYVQNNSFPEALHVMDEHNFVMISGSPGIGKTMLGRALVAYYLERQEYEELVYITGSIEQAQSYYREERSQIFFFDDFWGSVFTKNPSDRNEDKRLLHFLEKIRNRPNKKLVLTTREYVFQQGARRKNYPELARFLNEMKCAVNPDSYTKAHRAQILFNHLYFSDLNEDSLRYFIILKEYKHVINHRNYTPRLINTFIREFSRTGEESIFFGKRFLDYLRNPYDFYADAFEKQTSTSKFILLFILISNDPIRYNDLLKTLKKAIEPARSLGLSIDLTSIPDALATLENTFIITTEINTFNESELKFEFINPSINDFLLRYLRENIEVYGDILIQSACFFNQLDFVFDTCPDSHISDNSEEPLFGESIILTGEQRSLLKNKYLNEFDSLTYSTLDSGALDSQYTCLSKKEDTMVWELIRLTRLFDLEKDEDVRFFTAGKHKILTDALLSNSEGPVISHESMLNYPELTKILLPYLTTNVKGIIPAFYRAIHFTSEFCAFKWLGEVFPNEYKAFVDKNLRLIRKKAVQLVFDDADYFSYENDDLAFSQLVDMDIDEVFEMFNMRATPKFIELVYQAADLTSPSHQIHEHEILDLDKIASEEDEGYDESKVEQDYDSLLDEPSSDNYLKDEEIDSLMSTLEVSIEIQPEIRKLLTHIDLLHDRLVLTLTCEAVKSGHIDPTKATYEAELVNSLTNFQISQNLGAAEHKPPLHEVIAQLETIAFNTFFEAHLTTSKNVQQQLTKHTPATHFPTDEFLTLCFPLIIYRRQRVKFSSEFLARCFAVRHINKLSKATNTHFYKKTFNDFVDDKLMVSDGWWDVFAHFDEKNFFDNVAEPIIRQAVYELEHLPCTHQLAHYLQLLKLDFSIKKEVNETNYEHDSSRTSSWILDELAEFLDSSVNSFEIIDWFTNMLNESSGNEHDQLTNLFKSESEETNEETLSIEFSNWKPNIEALAIIDQIDTINGFSSQLSEFQSKLQLILKSKRLLLDRISD